jgi:hypothetical protein
VFQDEFHHWLAFDARHISEHDSIGLLSRLTVPLRDARSGDRPNLESSQPRASRSEKLMQHIRKYRG